MKCVRCRIDLVPERYERTEIDRWPRCKGVWLDGGELGKVQAHHEHWARQPQRNQE